MKANQNVLKQNVFKYAFKNLSNEKIAVKPKRIDTSNVKNIVKSNNKSFESIKTKNLKTNEKLNSKLYNGINESSKIKPKPALTGNSKTLAIDEFISKTKDKYTDANGNGTKLNGNRKVIINTIEKNGLAIDEFNKLRLTSVYKLADKQQKTMKKIRDDMPKITKDTILQKTIPECDIEGYLNKGWNEIGGYIARYDDVSHIKRYEDVVESFRLDYVTPDGKRPYPKGGNSYGYIKFTTDEVDEIYIPYGEIFGGTNKDPHPCTLNGFTAARNGEIVPESRIDGRITPKEGSELHKVVDGIDKIVGVFNGDEFKPVD